MIVRNVQISGTRLLPKMVDNPISIEELNGRIEQSVVQAVTADTLFMASATFREQCFHVCRVLRQVHIPPAPWSIIAQVMKVNERTVRSHRDTFAAHGNEVKTGGRPVILTEGQMDQVVDYIITNYKARNPKRIGEIRSWIREQFNIVSIPNTLHHIISRDPRIKPCRASPIDRKRYNVTHEEILRWYEETKAKLEGVPAHFIFNMDEMGHAVWADATETVCYVPADADETLVHYPVSRVGKRITLIALIAMDGSFAKPSIIISRKTWDDELVEEGFTPEKIEIYDQEHAFTNTGIFEDWFKDTFVPEVARRRQIFDYRGPAFLIMDNCSTHAGDEYEALCGANQIEPVWLPPHSSNQLQMLDLSIFGITKRKIARVNRLEQVNVQTEHIVQVVNSFMSAACPHNVIESFRNAGLSLRRDANNRIFCHVTPETARCLFVPIEAAPGVEELPGIEEEDPNVGEFQNRCARMIGATIVFPRP